jgi:hypothetical protein
MITFIELATRLHTGDEIGAGLSSHNAVVRIEGRTTSKIQYDVKKESQLHRIPFH